MNQTFEHSIEAALRDLENGVYTSQRAAAKAYNIPRSTIQARLTGRTNHGLAHQHQQRLTPDQEEYLAN